jgi:hypothetical protein
MTFGIQTGVPVVIIIIIIIIIITANAILLGGTGTTIKHNTQVRVSQTITHHSQTKYSTRSYKNR